ncbi:MAG: sigma-70 family RNA polymerase sigma factor [Planctomycetota bacterium]|jgi:RNA polymerase sigma factor (sigma-70 family)
MEITLQSAENVKHAAKIFEENSGMFRAAIRSQVNDKSVIDDIFQNLFLSLVHSPVPSDIENVEGYLRRAIRNDVIDSAIKNRCRRVREQKYTEMSMVSTRYDDPKDTVTMCDVIQHIFEIIEDRLPAHEARALIEKYRYNRDDGEAARIMGITRRSFSHYLCTGLKKARRYIQQNNSEQNIHSRKPDNTDMT